ncbi:hypothetical protein [Neobacillus sp. YIM B06451]|uniref:hypothetical protein n=1 Tax=Neobacillus sp. YIM B06451 TaxID=3070994 RepID=UPI00292D4583|nr:hypothetical protein [Neobacillus sp. YIM B06451]
MKGIYLINPKISLNGLSIEESFVLQLHITRETISRQKIKIIKLNPYQLYEYYTIPHALLYDLKAKQVQFDCLVYQSPTVVEDFMWSYLERWILISSYFKTKIICSEENNIYS